MLGWGEMPRQADTSQSQSRAIEADWELLLARQMMSEHFKLF